MLVLSRRAEQGMIVTVPPSTEPQDLEIRLLDIKHTVAKIGIKADPAIRVRRSEIPPSEVQSVPRVQPSHHNSNGHGRMSLETVNDV